MDAIATLHTLRRRGYSAAVEGERLKLRGPAKPPEEIEDAILKHRNELVRLEEIVMDEREVFDTARQYFGKREGCGVKRGPNTLNELVTMRLAAETIEDIDAAEEAAVRWMRQHPEDQETIAQAEKSLETKRRAPGRGRLVVSTYAEMDRLRKLAHPFYLELQALGLDLVGRNDGGTWTPEVPILRSLFPAHIDRARAAIEEHERGLLWLLFGGWAPDLEAIQGESTT